MGLDAYLYQFEGVDTDAIIKLSSFSDEPWAFEGFDKWNSMSKAEKKAHGPYPSSVELQSYQSKLIVKAKELGLPESSAISDSFGGVRVTFPSKKYIGLSVGDWDPFLYSVNSSLLHFTGKDLSYVFPEAEGDPHFFRPDWQAAKERLLGLVTRMKKDSLEDDEKGRYFRSSFDHDMVYIGVILETIDYVISQKNPKQFLIYWSI